MNPETRALLLSRILRDPSFATPASHVMIRLRPLTLGTIATLLFTTAIAAPIPARADGNAAVGTIFGGVVGGLIGNSLVHGRDRGVATVGGALVGAMVGNSIGQSADAQSYGYGGYGGGYGGSYGYRAGYGGGYDDEDDYAPRAYYPPPRVYYAAPPPVAYVPAPVYAEPRYAPVAQQGYCREYSTTIVVDGRTQPAYGTACLQPDGTWQAER
jgi:surface antigen